MRSALVRVLAELSCQIEAPRRRADRPFDRHPDAEIYRSQPGLGAILAARVLAEFGDDSTRFADAKARRNYAATSPITRASGTRRVVLARVAANIRLRDALYLQAFAALNVSPGARAYYDNHRARGATHHQALRALANRPYQQRWINVSGRSVGTAGIDANADILTGTFESNSQDLWMRS